MRIHSNDLSARRGLTAISLVRDESYLLPAFLGHYRDLGIERFIFLDDRSVDGTREYLLEQPDVMLLTDPEHRFGDSVQAFGSRGALRMPVVWRTALMRRFGCGRWSLVIDADEFLRLPDGWTLDDLVRLGEAAGRRSIGGVMLDVYPRDLAALRRGGDFDPERGWFFDGQAHFHLPGDGPPRAAYAGARARLLCQYGIRPLGRRARLRNLLREPSFPFFNYCWKTVLHYWSSEAVFRGSHNTSLPLNHEVMVPIVHYKFTPPVFAKVASAVEEQQYWKASQEYRSLAQLLDRMERRGGTFTYRRSRAADTCDAFHDTGNARFP
jgi:hypothetical protein